MEDINFNYNEKLVFCINWDKSPRWEGGIIKTSQIRNDLECEILSFLWHLQDFYFAIISFLAFFKTT